eukprot:m.262892 g.262892  ORF g.262892 m.262892 type:complete len:79 (+) comp26189_c0_seq1:626-862(+)
MGAHLPALLALAALTLSLVAFVTPHWTAITGDLILGQNVPYNYDQCRATDSEPGTTFDFCFSLKSSVSSFDIQVRLRC